MGSRDAGLASLYARFEGAATPAARQAARAAIQREMTARVVHGAAADAVAALVPDVAGLGDMAAADVGAMTDDVFDWDCYKALNAETEQACGTTYTDFTFKFVRMNALACRTDGRGAKGGVAAAVSAVHDACKATLSSNIVM